MATLQTKPTMKKTNIIRNIGFSIMSAIALMSSTPAHATASSVETAITTAVTDAKASGEAVLGVAATVVAGFLIFKLAKRAANKA